MRKLELLIYNNFDRGHSTSRSLPYRNIYFILAWWYVHGNIEILMRVCATGCWYLQSTLFPPTYFSLICSTITCFIFLSSEISSWRMVYCSSLCMWAFSHCISQCTRFTEDRAAINIQPVVSRWHANGQEVCCLKSGEICSNCWISSFEDWYYVNIWRSYTRRYLSV